MANYHEARVKLTNTKLNCILLGIPLQPLILKQDLSTLTFRMSSIIKDAFIFYKRLYKPMSSSLLLLSF